MKASRQSQGPKDSYVAPWNFDQHHVDDYFPIKQMQMGRFTGERWEQFGPVYSGKVGS